jgi:hypothetical protein
MAKRLAITRGISRRREGYLEKGREGKGSEGERCFQKEFQNIKEIYCLLSPTIYLVY